MGEGKRRNEQFRKTPKLCVYCGAPDGTTTDHVPPKGIFVKPRPHLITVPACEKCNGGASAIDEQFKVFLSLKVGGGHEAAIHFWKEGGLKSIRANQRLIREIRNGPRVVVNEGGKLRETLSYRWPAACHNQTIERITRGLYWNHFAQALRPDAKVDTYFFTSLDDEMLALANSLERRHIGSDDVFVYAYGRADDHPEFSTWIFQFYRGHWAGAFTYPPGFEDGDAALNAIEDEAQAKDAP